MNLRSVVSWVEESIVDLRVSSVMTSGMRALVAHWPTNCICQPNVNNWWTRESIKRAQVDQSRFSLEPILSKAIQHDRSTYPQESS